MQSVGCVWVTSCKTFPQNKELPVDVFCLFVFLILLNLFKKKASNSLECIAHKAFTRPFTYIKLPLLRPAAKAWACGLMHLFCITVTVVLKLYLPMPPDSCLNHGHFLPRASVILYFTVLSWKRYHGIAFAGCLRTELMGNIWHNQ